jgi:arylsulfatase A-like enzyme
MLPAFSPAAAAAPRGDAPPPNILVVVLDDIGMDQSSFEPYGWNGAPESPSMPVLAEIASKGVSFRNFWSTPECSPSRAAMLTGRHSFRTGVVTAVVDPMLPAVQLHPSEVTLPKLLRPAGYVSGMLGKYHLGGGPENTPPGFGYEAPFSTAGLDVYDGYWALPPSVDSTLGGQLPAGTLSCGTIGGIGVTAAACFPDGTCRDNLHPLDAMAIGGTPLVNPDGSPVASCAGATCGSIDFLAENAYYAWQRTITTPAGVTQPATPQREYLTNFVSRRTTEWIGAAERAGRPWIAFATHSSAHTPIQPPPPMLTGPAANDASCAFTGVGFRQQYKLMVESVDRSIGNMLADLGLGAWVDGKFVLGDLAAANVMLVVVNDNGTYAYNVLLPFSPQRAKQTVYESGVRSMCLVAGAGVASPGRSVDAQVSIVDLFGLVADAAGVEWQAIESPSRVIDCLPMMPYLVNPGQPPIREYNFAMYAQGIFAAGDVGPCVLGNTVIDGLITSPTLCADNGGCWLGGSSAPPYPVQNYCDLASTDPATAVVECGGTQYCFLPPDMAGQCPAGSVTVAPPTETQYAVRRGQWKLVVRQLPQCLAPNDCDVRLYLLDEPVPPNQPGIELPDGSPGVWDPLSQPLPAPAQAAYLSLKDELVRTLMSERKSLADGNLDGVVDGQDLGGLLAEWGSMGFWDVTQDGVVDGVDLGELLAAWGQVPFSTALVPDCLLASESVDLVREYSFDDGLEDSSGSGVTAVSMGGEVTGGAYVFGAGQGLQVPVNGQDWSDFDIEFSLRVSASQFVLNKLVDMFGQTQDRGLYRREEGTIFSFLPPFSPTSIERMPIGVPTLVRYSRDSATRTLTLRMNGVVQWTQPDPLGLAVPPPDGVVTFFADDSVTHYEETCSGSVGWIRIRSRTAK